MIDHDLAADLDKLAEAIARLKPISFRNPHVFHEERSELASKVRALAHRARTGAPAAPADVPAPIGRQSIRRHQVVDLEGRSVLVLTKRKAMHPLEVDGVRHDGRCSIFHTPPFRVVRICDCGATPVLGIRLASAPG